MNPPIQYHVPQHGESVGSLGWGAGRSAPLTTTYCDLSAEASPVKVMKGDVMSNVSSPQSSEDLYVQFAQAVLGRFQEFARTEPPPQYVGSYLEFTENGFQDQHYQGTNYWHLFQTHIGDMIGKLEPADHCVREYLKDGSLTVPAMTTGSGEQITNPTYEQYGSAVYHELLTPLMSAVERTGSYQLAPDQIRACHKDFLKRRLPPPPTHSLSINIPLVNFSTDLPRTRIGTLLDLEPLALERKTYLWNRSFGSMSLSGKGNPMPLTISSFMLSGSHEHTAGEQIRELPLFSDSRTIITALRLLKPGPVGVYAFYTDSEIASLGHMVSAWPSDELSVHGRDSVYTLMPCDLPSLQDLMYGLRKNESALRIPLRRFNQCYGRESGEDRIIDCVIALESCLLRGAGGAQLSYRFSLRGAALLANTAAPRVTRDLLDAIYLARNEIVHGGGELTKLSDRLKKSLKHCTPPVEPDKLPTTCHGITRDVLRTYVLRLRDGKSLDDLNRELDDRIADALVPRTS